MTRDPQRPRIALVLSGGGARGAYEVGVLRYLREGLGKQIHFDIITGTSVGAINGAYIAATSHRPKAQARMLQRVWRELSIDKVYEFGWRQVRDLPTTLFGRTRPAIAHGSRLGGLADMRHLENIVRERIPWRSLAENLSRGVIEAFACTATEVATGLSTVFCQTSDPTRTLRWEDGNENELVVRTPIGAEHGLASAAIPVLFPAVRIGERLYVDGSLRQNTPLRPAMRLGATRVVSVGLRRREEMHRRFEQMRQTSREIYPNAFFLLGKLLNALMLDKVEADLRRVERTNRMLEAGERLYGPDFGAKLAAAAGRDSPYVPIQTVSIRPSQDLGRVAWEVVRRHGLDHHRGLVANVVRRSIEADQEADAGESDLASYVLFDAPYLRQLIDLGYEDARSQRDELLGLLDG